MCCTGTCNEMQLMGRRNLKHISWLTFSTENWKAPDNFPTYSQLICSVHTRASHCTEFIQTLFSLNGRSHTHTRLHWIYCSDNSFVYSVEKSLSICHKSDMKTSFFCIVSYFQHSISFIIGLQLIFKNKIYKLDVHWISCKISLASKQSKHLYTCSGNVLNGCHNE